MPKKTKKDKILAEARREKILESQLKYQFVKPPTTDVKTASANQPRDFGLNKINTVKTPQTDLSIIEHKYLGRDLFKILVFTLFAVFSQIVLYYFLRG